MPSPMAVKPPSPSPSMFNRKKRSSIPFNSAVSYLSAVSQMDSMARAARSETLTPASTFSGSSSSIYTTSSSESTSEDEAGDGEDFLYRPRNPPTSEQTTLHTEFGHCNNEDYRHLSRHVPGTPFVMAEEQEPPYYVLFAIYVSFLTMICFGHIRDFFGKRLKPANYKHLMSSDGYAALNSDFDSFYTRRFKTRLDDCFNRPVTRVPGRTIVLLDRETKDFHVTHTLTGTKTRALNISSYNYLGFAQARGGCADAVEESIRRYGISSCGSRLDSGTIDLHGIGEALVAKFVGQEDALITSMGFATNSTIIPALASKGTLVISDEHNHASIRFGVRLSRANVRMFKHNDINSLESLLKEVISQGQPRTHRPWKRILLIVEGLYSMEGTLVNLPAIMELKKKYKFHLFVDEAHSIGALGPHGRGVADYFGIDPRSIDILMGTFTKSFGAAGGYISGSKALIDRLRLSGHSAAYAEAMSPPVLTQIIASMASIMGLANPLQGNQVTEQRIVHPGPAPASLVPNWLNLPPTLRDGSEGQVRLRRLAFNARYLSIGLKKLGFITYGHPDSPIVPLLLFTIGRMPAFSRMMLERNVPIVVVVVAYPATSLVTARVRFCVSAAHTKDDIDELLRACDEIGDHLDLKHASGERWTVDQVIERAVDLVRTT